MRKLGLALLLIGWGLLCWKTFTAKLILTGVVADQIKAMPELDAYSRTDVLNGMFRLGSMIWDRLIPGAWYSGLMMFAGGLCLAFCPTKANRKECPNQASQAIVAPSAPQPER